MPKVAITQNPTIVKNGGPITSDVYKSHATDLWTKGALLELISGLLQPVADSKAGGVTIDTSKTGTSGARLFIALEDHLTEGSVFVAVQEIKANSIIEMQVMNSVGETFTVTKGDDYAAYQKQSSNAAVEGNGIFGLDSGNTTDPVFHVIDVQANYEPFNPDSTADYRKVLVKVLSAILA